MYKYPAVNSPFPNQMPRRQKKLRGKKTKQIYCDEGLDVKALVNANPDFAAVVEQEDGRYYCKFEDFMLKLVLPGKMKGGLFDHWRKVVSEYVESNGMEETIEALQEAAKQVAIEDEEEAKKHEEEQDPLKDERIFLRGAIDAYIEDCFLATV